MTNWGKFVEEIIRGTFLGSNPRYRRNAFCSIIMVLNHPIAKMAHILVRIFIVIIYSNPGGMSLKEYIAKKRR